MNIRYNYKNGVFIVIVEGDIDNTTASDVKECIKYGISRYRCYKVILDLTNVYFMDSSGIGMLIGRYKELTLYNGEIVLSGINKGIDKILSLSGMKKIIKCFDNINFAFNYFEGGCCDE